MLQEATSWQEVTGDPFSTAWRKIFLDIDVQRRAHGITVGQLLTHAGVAPRTWSRLKDDPIKVRPNILRRLRSTLAQLLAEKETESDRRAAALALLHHLREELGQRFGIDRSSAAAFQQARSRCRMRATYLLVMGGGFSIPETAAILGVTRQAVWKTLRVIDAERQANPEIKASLDRLEYLVRFRAVG